MFLKTWNVLIIKAYFLLLEPVPINISVVNSNVFIKDISNAERRVITCSG